MKSKYMIAGLSILVVSILAVSVANAQASSRYADMMGSGNGAHMGMMQTHSPEDINEMKEHHPDLTDEGINKMTESCPMMRASK